MNMRMLTPERLRLEAGFPLRVQPGQTGVSLAAEIDALRSVVDHSLERDGAILFSGFTPAGVEGFQRFAASLIALTSKMRWCRYETIFLHGS